MKIDVAGAGAGKTTGLANEIIEKHKCIPNNRVIYCVAFTNNAASSIEEKLKSFYGIIPRNIVVSTIHSFLYHEFISPYFYLIYNKHYKSLSTIELPTVQKYKNSKLNELENKNILHIEKIPERAKWVVAKKSSDRVKEKTARTSILNAFLTYCDTIFVDEAQDIDSNMKEVLLALDNAGAEIILKGDPKQDLRGYGCFRELIEHYSESVTYNPTCHRCPTEHLRITNSLILPAENQVSQKSGGAIELLFENKCCVTEILRKSFDLKYIYKRNDRFETHCSKDTSVLLENIYYEVHCILVDTFKSEDIATIDLTAYKFSKVMIRWKESGKSLSQIINPFGSYVGGLTKMQYARLCTAIQSQECPDTTVSVVNSIESIKGLEGDDCLFILTLDLAAYLFKEKTAENKTKNALYVALTRSLNKLTILVCKEVEDEYGKQRIVNLLAPFIES